MICVNSTSIGLILLPTSQPDTVCRKEEQTDDCPDLSRLHRDMPTHGAGGNDAAESERVHKRAQSENKRATFLT